MNRLKLGSIVIVLMISGCSSGIADESPAGTSVSSETSITVTEESMALAKSSFQQKVGGELIPDIRTVSDVLRSIQVFGQLDDGSSDDDCCLEEKICEEFSFERLLSGGSRLIMSTKEFEQDIAELEYEEFPDIFYTIKFISLADVDTDRLVANVTEISDVFFLSADKRCTGELIEGAKFEDFDFTESAKFTTGFFPELSTQYEEIVHFVQLVEPEDESYGRAYSLFLLKPADVALALIVTGVAEDAHATPDEVLDEVGRVSRAIREVWLSKVRADSSWLELAK